MSDHDQPMALGDHLEELRRRLLLVVLALGVVAIVAMAFQAQLKTVIERPLRAAIAMASDEAVARLRLSRDPDEPVMRLDSLIEGPINAIRLSIYVAITVAFPLLVYQIWAFVAPGLRREERRAGFLFLPAAVLFFYGGVVLGYAVGLPYLFRLLIQMASAEHAVLDLRQNFYLSFFGMMTLAFGLVMDIPWLLMVLVRTRVVTPDQVARARRFVVLIAAVVAALITPPDPVSQIVMLALILVLFECGLLASRLIHRRAEAVTDAAADAIPDLGAGDNDEERH